MMVTQLKKMDVICVNLDVNSNVLNVSWVFAKSVVWMVGIYTNNNAYLFVVIKL